MGVLEIFMKKSFSRVKLLRTAWRTDSRASWGNLIYSRIIANVYWKNTTKYFIKQMNKFFKILFITSIILSGCGFNDDALGSWPERTFLISRKKLIAAIGQLYNQNVKYKVPGKWMEEDSSEIKSYFYLPSITFYFNENPEEMYFVTFIGDNAMLADSSKTVIAIRSVNNGEGKWLRYVDESPSERIRIEKRFDKEIISKLELITGRDALKEQLGH